MDGMVKKVEQESAVVLKAESARAYDLSKKDEFTITLFYNQGPGGVKITTGGGFKEAMYALPVLLSKFQSIFFLR